MMRALRFLPVIGAATLLAPASARAEGPAGSPGLTLAIDGGLGARKLTWKDDIFGELRDYNLAAAPVVGGEVSIHPGAFFTQGPLSWFGIHTRAEGMPGLRSRRSQHDVELPTTAWSFSTSVVMRAPVRFGAVSLDVGAAGRTFKIGRAGITDPDVPSVRYLGPRFGLGLDFRLRAGLSVAPRAAFMVWTTKGDIASEAWFPATTAVGVDLGVRLSWAVPHGFAPYLDLAWARQILALRPAPGDARVAGGAADDVVSARLGVAWSLAVSHSDR